MQKPMSGREARQKLYEIMANDKQFDTKANQALSLGRKYLSVEKGHLTQIDPESDYWRVVHSTEGPDGQFPSGRVLDLEETYCRKTLNKETVQLHDAPEQGWTDDPAYELHGLQTYHATALMIDNEPHGTVCFASSDARERPFTEDETMFAELISRMLEHELKQKRTKETVERLDQFASVVSHDLRNPLAVAQGNIDIAREKHKHSEKLLTASQALDRMEELIDDVLALARQGKRVENATAVSLSSIVNECWAAVESPKATIEVVSDFTFCADPQRVKRLFENIFRNAIEHGGADVTIHVGELEDAAGFYIENSGKPIPEEKRDHIFESGFSTGEDGLGLGLAIVKGVVSAHEWDISVTESSLGGPRFVISEVIPA